MLVYISVGLAGSLIISLSISASVFWSSNSTALSQRRTSSRQLSVPSCVVGLKIIWVKISDRLKPACRVILVSFVRSSTLHGLCLELA